MRKSIREKIGELKNVLIDNKDVTEGYSYWVSYLKDMIIDIFEWEGLPDTLPEEELERRLMNHGFAIVFKHPIEGIITSDGSLYDYDIYRRYRMFNLYNPYRTFHIRFLPGGKQIGKDGVVVYNNSIEKYIDHKYKDNLLHNTICRYARMLADVESTLSSELITQRMPFLPVASNRTSADSVKNVFRRLEVGEMEIAIDSDFLQDFKVLKNKDLSPGYLTELIQCRENILKMFYREVGMYMPEAQRERLLVDEIENAQSKEKTLIYSLLREREKACKELNEKFCLDVKVRMRSELYSEMDVTEMGEYAEPCEEDEEDVEPEENVEEDVEEEDTEDEV